MAPKHSTQKGRKAGLKTEGADAYKRTWHDGSLNARSLSNAAKTTIADFDPSSKLWKVYRGKPSGRGRKPVLLCYLPHKYFDGFRLLNRYFQLAYHTSAALQDTLRDFEGSEGVRSRLEKDIRIVNRLRRHFYLVLDLAMSQMKEGKDKSAEYCNARIGALDIFLRVVYHSPDDVSEVAINAALLRESDPLLYGVLRSNSTLPCTAIADYDTDWSEWAKRNQKEFLYGPQPDSASQHVTNCKTIGIPLCPDVQTLTDEEIEKLRSMVCRPYLPVNHVRSSTVCQSVTFLITDTFTWEEFRR